MFPTLKRMAWLSVLAAASWFSAPAATPVVLLTDNFTGTGTPDTMNVNYNLANRQTGALALVPYTVVGNCQVGNGGEPHDGGSVLLCAFGGTTALNRNFNQAWSAGGLKISFDMDPNSHVDHTDITTWAAVNLGAGFADRNTGVNGAGAHFGILFRANGKIQAFDGATVVSPDPAPNWAPDGNYSGQLKHIDLVLTDPADGNPFDGSGDTQIDVFVDGGATPVFSYSKLDGYANNHINFQGDWIVDFENLVITQVDPPSPPSVPWTVASWSSDASSGVSDAYAYSHAYNFASGQNAVINGITFTGVAGGNPSVPGRFSMTGPGNVFGGDANNVTGGGAIMARDFIYNGFPATFTLEGLTAGTQYVLTFYSVGWEAWGGRQLTFSAGSDQRIIDQDAYGNNNGIRMSYAYTADVSGTLTVTVTPLGGGSFHIYGFSNRETTPIPRAPVITAQPRGLTVAQGLDVALQVGAYGEPPPAYLWLKNGAPMSPEQTNPTLTLTAVTPAEAGDYQVVVSNSVTSVTSVVATLVVGLPMTNPSFEANTFTVWPGYVNGNGPITGWNALGGHGINPAGGSSPFGDNGVVPHGSQMAFMQADGPLSQTVSGLTVGSQYYVHYYENSRSTVTPSLELRLGGVTAIAPHLVFMVGGANPYHEMFSDVFVATTTDLEVAFVKSNPLGGDSTALVDNVAVVEIPAGTAPLIARPPASSTVSVGQSVTFTVQGVGYLPLLYQWMKNGVDIDGATGSTLTLNNVQKPEDTSEFTVRIANASGAVTSAVARLTVDEPIPDLFNTGVGSDRVTLADGAVDPHYQLVVNPDTGSTDAIVEDSKAFPISTGTWLPYSTVSGWIGPRINTAASAVGLYTYRTVIDLTGRDPSTVVIMGRWSTDNNGRDIRVNGVSTGNPENGGFNVYTPFTIYGTNSALVAGSNAIDFIVENVAAIGYTGLRVEILRSNVRIPPGVAPRIIRQPTGQSAAIGDSVTFTGEGWGAGPLSYQWNKDGVPLSGQTGLSLVLSSLTAGDSGLYTLTVSNSADIAVSDPAALCVWLQPLPGVVFGTGVDDTGTLLDPGATDLHYVLTASPDPNYPGPDAYVVSNGYPIQAGAWLLNGPNSKWIAPSANQNDSGTSGGGNVEGSYTYQTTFDLSGYDVSKIKLVGGWAVDNGGTALLVNGASSGFVSPGFGGMTPFTLTSAHGLVAGLNTLDFVVSNAASAPPATVNPTGLRVDLKAYLNILDLQAALRISRNGETISVSWSPVGPCLKLQTAPSVSGPWNDIVNAPNPYTTGAANAPQFFRIVSP